MLNEVNLIGRTGDKPEIRKMNSGDTVASFSLATSESWKDDKGEKQERTQWHRCVSFNQGLNKVFEKYVGKGDLLMVKGQLEHRSYDKDGETKYVSEVVLRPYKGELVMLGSPKGDDRQDDRSQKDNRSSGYGNSGRRQQRGEDYGSDQQMGGGMPEDEIPFDKLRGPALQMG
ncbi:single-stranded DNA-binding protein [Methylobacterium oryzae]|uniref:single-stranded DNA-binding protein n=1 Tax=Methylobacterium oryzae TaxID=334852 RepID=UPI002F31935E